jgi:hypothetical protein
VLAYWQSGCRALPADEAGLAAISHCYGAPWHRVRQPLPRGWRSPMPSCCMPDRHDRQSHGRPALPARLNAQRVIRYRPPHSPNLYDQVAQPTAHFLAGPRARQSAVRCGMVPPPRPGRGVDP